MWPVPVPSSCSLSSVLAPRPEHRSVLEPCPGESCPMLSPGVVPSRASGTPVRHAMDAAKDAAEDAEHRAGLLRQGPAGAQQSTWLR